MKTILQVLSEEEKHQIHARTLEILSETGVRVDTPIGRQLLGDAGAQVDENNHIVRFPKTLVEESLRLTKKDFSLGARRPGWDLQMNAGNFTLLADGEGTFVTDAVTGERRPSTAQDWMNATRLIDSIDEIGVYWSMVERSDEPPVPSAAQQVSYLANVFRNFSKHVQDGSQDAEMAPWILEVLQVIFGDKEAIRKTHPFSFLLCPQSPLVIDQQYTDACLALLGWDIPVAIMPMPLMGGTAPGSLLGTIILANCEVLATLTMIQAGAPGTPIIYAPVIALSNLRDGTYSAGAVESGLTGAASTEMARYYDLPAETSGFSTGQFVPNIQSGYDRALSTLPSMLSWPDILVGAGLLGSSMILSLEQMLIDAEIFRMCRQTHRGIVCSDDKWLDDVIDRVGPGGHFLDQPSTTSAVRSHEWYINQLGVNVSFEEWEAAGRPKLAEEARDKADQLLSSHQPLPLDEEVNRELERIQKSAQDLS